MQEPLSFPNRHLNKGVKIYLLASKNPKHRKVLSRLLVAYGQLLLDHLGIFPDEIITQDHGDAAEQVDVDGTFFEDTVEVARVAMHLPGQPRLTAFLLFQHLGQVVCRSAEQHLFETFYLHFVAAAVVSATGAKRYAQGRKHGGCQEFCRFHGRSFSLITSVQSYEKKSGNASFFSVGSFQFNNSTIKQHHAFTHHCSLVNKKGLRVKSFISWEQ